MGKDTYNDEITKDVPLCLQRDIFDFVLRAFTVKAKLSWRRFLLCPERDRYPLTIFRLTKKQTRQLFRLQVINLYSNGWYNGTPYKICPECYERQGPRERRDCRTAGDKCKHIKIENETSRYYLWPGQEKSCMKR